MVGRCLWKRRKDLLDLRKEPAVILSPGVPVVLQPPVQLRVDGFSTVTVPVLDYSVGFESEVPVPLLESRVQCESHPGRWREGNVASLVPVYSLPRVRRVSATTRRERRVPLLVQE